MDGISLIKFALDGWRALSLRLIIQHLTKDTNGKTKNNHFAEMLLESFERGFNPELVCFDSWYASIKT